VQVVGLDEQRAENAVAEIDDCSGTAIAEYVRRWIAEPLDVDPWMGPPDQLISRLVPGRWERTEATTPEPEWHYPPGSTAALRPALLAEDAPMDPDFSNANEVREHKAAHGYRATPTGPFHGCRCVR
jgi:hypothetical protein